MSRAGPSTSRHRRDVEPEDGELIEEVQATRPATKWRNPLASPRPTPRSNVPSSSRPTARTPGTIRLGLPSSSSTSKIVSSYRPEKSPERVPPPVNHSRERESSGSRKGDLYIPSRYDEDDRFRAPRSPPRYRHDEYRRRSRSPPRYESAAREASTDWGRYHRERADRYAPHDRTDIYRHERPWREERSTRDERRLRDADATGMRRGEYSRPSSSRSPRDSPGKHRYESSRRRSSPPVEDGEIKPSEAAATLPNGEDGTPPERPPSPSDPPSSASPEKPGLNVNHNEQRRLTMKHRPSHHPSAETGEAPPPPPDSPPPAPIDLPPPPPDSPPLSNPNTDQNPVTPMLAESRPPVEESAQKQKPLTGDVEKAPDKVVNRALEFTKSHSRYDDQPSGLRAEGRLSVPPAPNPHAHESTTPASTPSGKVDLSRIEVASSRTFKRRTAAEELSMLHKVFKGTTTLDAYDVGLKLGEGTFGVVTKGVEIATKRAIALKKLITHNVRDGVSVTTVREIKLLKSLSHKNVVPIIDMVVQPKPTGSSSGRQEIFMVFPYMDHDLCGLLGNKEFKPRMSVMKILMKQIIEGMAYIHANNCVHRDIKTANILVDKRGVVMIADFGLARSWTRDGAMPPHLPTEYTNMVVTRWYRAPELLLGDTRYGPAVDMWSLGCVLGEMFNKDPILAGDSDRDQLYRIFSRCGPLNLDTFPGWDSLPGFPDARGYPWDKTPQDTPLVELAQRFQTGMDRSGADLMAKLLALDPKRRLTAGEALEHPWFWISPMPALIANGLISVESSHEMTTGRNKGPPAAPAVPPQAARPAHRPPYHLQRPPLHQAGAWGLPQPSQSTGMARPPLQAHNKFGPGSGTGPGSYRPNGMPSGAPYNSHHPPLQAFGNHSQGSRPPPNQQLISRGIPPPPFNLAPSGPKAGVPPAPFGLAGAAARPQMMNGAIRPPPLGSMKRGLPMGGGDSWRPDKRPREIEEGELPLPY